MAEPRREWWSQMPVEARLDALWDRIDAVDNKVTSELQTLKAQNWVLIAGVFLAAVGVVLRG